MKRSSVKLGLGIVTILLAAVWSATPAAAESVRSPTPSGPIPANAPLGDPFHDHAHFTPPFDLADCGYVGREFFIEGAANRYDTPVLAPDELGIGSGGMRLVDAEAPVALGSRQNPGSAFCVPHGTHQPFDDATLKVLYPRQGKYFGAVLLAVLDSLEHRYVTLAAAIETIMEAGLSDIPPESVGRPRGSEAPSRP